MGRGERVEYPAFIIPKPLIRVCADLGIDGRDDEICHTEDILLLGEGKVRVDRGIESNVVGRERSAKDAGEQDRGVGFSGEKSHTAAEICGTAEERDRKVGLFHSDIREDGEDLVSVETLQDVSDGERTTRKNCDTGCAFVIEPLVCERVMLDTCDRKDRDLAVGDGDAGEVPIAEVREGEDDAGSLGE